MRACPLVVLLCLAPAACSTEARPAVSSAATLGAPSPSRGAAFESPGAREALVASNEPERVTLGNSLAAPAQLSEQDRDLLFVPSDLLADFRLAAELRRALAMDRSLSLLARRIQIHAVDGVVTLRGEVCSSAERSAIVTTARRLAGDDQVKAWITIKC